MIKQVFGCILICCFTAIACDKNKVIERPIVTPITGTGSFIFADYEPLANKPIEIFYHIPETATESTPILLVFHGNGRDALESRDALIAQANSKNFIVVTPEFSTTYFPGSDAYHLANIFEDGDNPSPETLNNEAVWTFSVIEPIIERIKTEIGNTTSTYDVFGHSAGAQIAHRFLLFQPNAHINRLVSAAAGWYTVPDNAIDFPYGLQKSPAENTSLSVAFLKSVYVIVGAIDTDPNSFSLRHNAQADAQGLQRVARAQYFFEKSQAAAQSQSLSFNWQYNMVPNTSHDFVGNAHFAIDLLYP